MHDLYATMHISEMAFARWFLGSIAVKFFHKILGILIFLWYYEQIWLYTGQKASGKTIWEICIVA